MKPLPSLLLFLSLIAGTSFSQDADNSGGGSNDPHANQRCEVKDSTVTFRISGILQPNDSQFVHDLSCEADGSKLGSVRMRWAHKYGQRYGGVGIVLDGDLEEAWRGDGGWITVRITGKTQCPVVVVRPRLAKIPD